MEDHRELFEIDWLWHGLIIRGDFGNGDLLYSALFLFSRASPSIEEDTDGSAYNPRRWLLSGWIFRAIRGVNDFWQCLVIHSTNNDLGHYGFS